MQVQIKNYLYDLSDYKIPLFVHGSGKIIKEILHEASIHEGGNYLEFLKRFESSPRMIYFYCGGERAMPARALTAILDQCEQHNTGIFSNTVDELFQSFIGVSSRGNKPIILPKFYSEELAYLTGVIMGDGHVSKRLEIRIAEETEEHSDYLVDLVYGIFGYRPLKIPVGNYNLILISSAPIHFFFTKVIGLPEGKKKYKELIPDFVRLNSDFKLNFLRGLFDSDGGVTISKNKRSVLLSCSNEVFLRELKSLMGEFGVNFNLYKSGNRKGFELRTFKQSNIKNFVETIGFKHPVKKQRLSAPIAQW